MVFPWFRSRFVTVFSHQGLAGRAFCGLAGGGDGKSTLYVNVLSGISTANDDGMISGEYEWFMMVVNNHPNNPLLNNG